VAANLVIISSKETEISDLEKDISDRARLYESTISDRDATIASLGEKVSELKTEVNDMREFCRVAKETTTRLTMQLQATEASVSELEAEADVSKTILGVLETSNANLLHDQETIMLELEQAKAKCIEAENEAENFRNHAKAVSEELSSLKILQDEHLSKIDGLADSLARTSSDAQAMRENSRMLEASVANYEAEIQKKEDIRQNLEIQVKQNDFRIAQLSADLQTVEKSVEDMRTRLEEANKKAVDAESLNEELTTELSLKNFVVQQYQEDLANIEGQFADSQLEVAEWTTKHATDTMTLSSTISELRDALATANSDVERLTSQLQVVEDERLSIRQDLVRKEVDLFDAISVLDQERKVKLAAEADLNTYVGQTRELMKELGYYKTSKEADEATISSLRALFMKLRRSQDSQLQLFEEVEQEVIDLCSPMPQRCLY
jgi:chromosome segregation ATPase